MADEKSIFVTVGTTSFDRLIETVSSKSFVEVSYNLLIFIYLFKKILSSDFSFFLQLLERLGYRSIVLQIGRGVYEPESIDRKHFSLKYYRYKDSIAADIHRASLVISHAGKENFECSFLCLFACLFVSIIIYH